MAVPATGQSSSVADQIISITSDTNFPSLYHPHSPKNQITTEPKLPNTRDEVQEDKSTDNNTDKIKYADLVKPNGITKQDSKFPFEPIPIKQPAIIDGVPQITFNL